VHHACDVLDFGANIFCAASRAYGTMPPSYADKVGTFSASGISGFMSLFAVFLILGESYVDDGK
jgi:hypothetical protein